MRHALLARVTLLVCLVCAACGLERATPASPAASRPLTTPTVVPSPTLEPVLQPALATGGPASPEPTLAPASPPSAERVLANLVAFARLYGLVRYFHPSDAAAAARWGPIAENGATLIADASGPEDLAARLQALFGPIAPTLRVYTTGQVPDTAPELSPPADTAGLEVVMWRHYGVTGEERYSTYHSDRIRAAAPGGTVPDGFHDPRRPYFADLGGGVAAVVPLALFADNSGTLPHYNVPEGEAPDRTLPVTAQGSRTAAVVIAWNVLAYFYPYFDVVSVDWPQVLEDALAEALAADSPRATLTALQRLAARLDDGHATIISRFARDAFVPEVLLAWIEGQIAVLHAQGTAAQQVRTGDVVVTIDGRPALEVLVEAETLISGATPQWRRTVALQTMLEGREGSTVVLELRRFDGTTLSVQMERRAYPWSLTEPRRSSIEEIEPGIFYVALDEVPYESFVAALPRFQGAQGVVFDLRGYPRALHLLCHLIDAPVNSPQMYVPVVTGPDPLQTTYERVEWELEPVAPHLTARLAFLIDGRAISAAETLLSIVEHYRLGELVGEPTAGTNGDVNRITLPGNHILVWTGMKVLKQDGSRHHGVGILPTVPVSRTLEGIRQGRDEQLERAVELVRGP